LHINILLIRSINIQEGPQVNLMAEAVGSQVVGEVHSYSVETQGMGYREIAG